MGTKSLVIEILGDATSAQKAFKDTDDAGDSFGKKLGGLAGKLGGLAAGAGILKFGKDSVGAFKDSEAASTKLTDAFARFPALADSNTASFEKLATSLAKKTRFDDDATKSGQAVLAQFGLTGGQIEQLTPLLQDYAAKTGKDLPEAADALGKAMLGKGKALAEVGIKFKDTGDLAGNFDQVMGGLRGQVGGFAEKEGKTAAGKAEIMKNQFGELQELVGSKLVPVIAKLTDVVTKVVGWFANMSPGMQKVIMVGVGLVALIAGIVKVTQLWTVVQAAFNVIMALNPVVLVVLAIVALVAIIVIAYQNVGWFRDLVDGAFGLIQSVISGVVDWVTANWPLLLAILTGPIGLAVLFITRNWDTIKDAFAAVVTWIGDRISDWVGFYTGLPGRVAGALASLWGMITGGISTARDWVHDRIEDLVGFVTGLPGRIGRAAAGMWDGIADAFRSAINFIVRGWNSLQFKIPGFSIGPIGYDGFTLGVPDIPYLAKGGTITSRGLGVVGELGPELVDLPRGATVSPLAAGGGSGPVTLVVPVSIDGREVARATVSYTRDELLRLATGRRLGFT